MGITPILTFPHKGGREKLDSGICRNGGYARFYVREDSEMGNANTRRRWIPASARTRESG